MREDPRPGALKGPIHWQVRAEEMRTKADQTRSTFARARLEQIAKGYDRLARCATGDGDYDSLRMRLAADCGDYLDRRKL